jgi:hypothetical protein
MDSIVHHWADVISATALSQWFQDQEWVIPTSQSIHIVCVSIVFGSAVMLSLRVVGIGASGRSVSQLAGTLVPWMYRALIVLLVTGSLQTFAEPLRQFVTPAFWCKMCLVVCAVSLTGLFARSVRNSPEKWDTAALRPAVARLLALVWLGLWIGIIFCGRFIGYTWQFHT